MPVPDHQQTNNTAGNTGFPFPVKHALRVDAMFQVGGLGLRMQHRNPETPVSRFGFCCPEHAIYLIKSSISYRNHATPMEQTRICSRSFAADNTLVRIFSCSFAADNTLVRIFSYRSAADNTGIRISPRTPVAVNTGGSISFPRLTAHNTAAGIYSCNSVVDYPLGEKSPGKPGTFADRGIGRLYFIAIHKLWGRRCCRNPAGHKTNRLLLKATINPGCIRILLVRVAL